MSRVRVCVVKVGGSLLATKELPGRLRTWLLNEATVHAPTHFVLLVGGGKLVDSVRQSDRRTPLNRETAHWLCIDLLEATGRLLAAQLPELDVVGDFASLELRLHSPGVTLFCPRQFLRSVEPYHSGTRLVSGWSVTSDSIAGRLAVVLSADELVLLKSVHPPVAEGESAPLDQLAFAGYVDAFFPKLAMELPKSTRFTALS